MRRSCQVVRSSSALSRRRPQTAVGVLVAEGVLPPPRRSKSIWGVTSGKRTTRWLGHDGDDSNRTKKTVNYRSPVRMFSSIATSNGNEEMEEEPLQSSSSSSSSSLSSSSSSTSHRPMKSPSADKNKLSPSMAIKVLEEAGSSQLSKAEQLRLLRLILSSNPSIGMLEKVTRLNLWWNNNNINDDDDDDDDSSSQALQSLVTAWARLPAVAAEPPADRKQSEKVPSRGGGGGGGGVGSGSTNNGGGNLVTGAVVAAQLLQEWGQRHFQQKHKQQRQQQRHSSTAQTPTTTSVLQYPPLVCFRSVLMALAGEGNYQVAGRVLTQLLDPHGPVQADQDCFHRVLQACCTAGALEPATKWWEAMTATTRTTTATTRVRPNRSTLKIMLQTHVNHYAHYQTPGTGLAAYQLLQDYCFSPASNNTSIRIDPDMVSINITLNALAQEGNYDLAHELFLELLQREQAQQEPPNGAGKDNDDLASSRRPSSTSTLAAAARIDPIPLRTVLKACAQANTLEAAERAEEFLQSLHALPCVDARAYTTVVAIWCKLGQPERAKILLEQLTSLYLETGSKTTTTATTTTSGSRLNENSQAMDEVDEDWIKLSPTRMRMDPRLRPDPLSFRTVIGAFSLKIGRMVGPNSSISMIEEEVAPLAAQAEQVLNDMYATMGYTPNLVTCNTVINCWAQAKQPEKAEDFLQLMEQHWNIAPDIVSYNTLIACHAKLGNLHECTALLSRLVGQHAANNHSSSSTSSFPSPNTRTVTAVITALSKQGTAQAAEEAEKWFLHMQEWHVDYGWDCAPNVVTLNALLTCWARACNGPRAEFLLRQFQHYSSSSVTAQGGSSDNNGYVHVEPPNTVSYNTVLQAYTAAASSNNSNSINVVQKVENLLEELIAVGLQPDERTVQIAQRALEKQQKRNSAETDEGAAVISAAQKWKEWKQRFFYYVASSSSSSQSKKKSKSTKSGGDSKISRAWKDKNKRSNAP